jgi:hypothetical protein
MIKNTIKIVRLMAAILVIVIPTAIVAENVIRPDGWYRPPSLSERLFGSSRSFYVFGVPTNTYVTTR